MERVAIVGGLRTAFVKTMGVFSEYSAVNLMAHVLKEAYDQFDLARLGLDEVIAGSVLHDPAVPNLAREAVFRANLPKSVPAHSVSNNCITGLVAVNYAAESIRNGRIMSALAGGAEAMSKPTLTFRPDAQEIFLKLSQARNFSEKVRQIARFRPSCFMPALPSPKEPSTGLTMGQHCELMVKEFSIPREAQDQWAFESHQKAARAQAEGKFSREIVRLNSADSDNIIRASTSLEKLSSLKPVFDKTSNGTLTAGNSSALTDGASLIWLMAESQARKLGIKILAFLEASEFAAVDPQQGLLMGPAVSVPKLLKRLRLSVSEIDLFEIHEAFAGQVLCNLSAMENGWKSHPEIEPVGLITRNKINPLGGSLALGHPFAATGGRLICSVINQMQSGEIKKAMISVCAAGAMGGAMLLSKAD